MDARVDDEQLDGQADRVMEVALEPSAAMACNRLAGDRRRSDVWPDFASSRANFARQGID
jgi:hypothetical protein